MLISVPRGASSKDCENITVSMSKLRNPSGQCPVSPLRSRFMQKVIFTPRTELQGPGSPASLQIHGGYNVKCVATKINNTQAGE